MKTPALVLLALVGMLPGSAACRMPASRPAEVEPDMANEAKLLESSTDSEELETVAVALAGDSRPESHALLRKYLESAAFLDRLDNQEEYLDLGFRLRIENVLEALAENTAPTAAEVLVALTRSRGFLEESRRTDLLILACAAVRPPPPDLLKFWDTHCQPLDGFTPLTIRALVRNGSEPAVKLLEKKLLDQKHSTAHRVNWMRFEILRRRDDLPLLECCDRLIRGPLPDELRVPLVAVLFEYRKREWYRGDNYPEPPPRAEASAAALQRLKAIGEFALKGVPISPQTRSAIEETLAAIAQRKK